MFGIGEGVHRLEKGQRPTLAVFPAKIGAFIQKVVLQNEDVPHIVPVRKHGQELKKILRGNNSRYVQYTMMDIGEPLDLSLAIDVQYLQREE